QTFEVTMLATATGPFKIIAVNGGGDSFFTAAQTVLAEGLTPETPETDSAGSTS
ncbi:hypothetical protein V5O48_016233, partial [Marasmius crinis-equi]